MKKMILFLLATAAVSCGLAEVGSRPHRGNGDVWVRPGMNPDSLAAGESVVYVTAVDYADSYDLLTDGEKGQVKCSLVVYADGSLLMKVPVGDRYEVSSDPDTHWMVNGHLYTNYISESETVVKRDGKEFIRYSSREMICDLTEYEDDIHVLTHSVDNEGFAYRVNGESVFSAETGDTFGTLFCRKDTVAFAYREPITSESGTLERYYYFLNGEKYQTAVRDDIKKVWDIVFHKGRIRYVASLVGIPSPVLLGGENLVALSLPEGCDVLSCKIICNEEALYIWGQVEDENGDVTTCLWQSDGLMHQFPPETSLSSFCMDGDGICCILNPSSSDSEGEIYKCGDYCPMPSGTFSMGSRTSAVSRGILHAGLSSFNADPPFIWKEEVCIPLKINGFITSVSLSGN